MPKSSNLVSIGSNHKEKAGTAAVQQSYRPQGRGDKLITNQQKKQTDQSF